MFPYGKRELDITGLTCAFVSLTFFDCLSDSAQAILWYHQLNMCLCSTDYSTQHKLYSLCLFPCMCNLCADITIYDDCLTKWPLVWHVQWLMVDHIIVRMRCFWDWHVTYCTLALGIWHLFCTMQHVLMCNEYDQTLVHNGYNLTLICMMMQQWLLTTQHGMHSLHDFRPPCISMWPHQTLFESWCSLSDSASVVWWCLITLDLFIQTVEHHVIHCYLMPAPTSIPTPEPICGSMLDVTFAPTLLLTPE